MVAYDFKGNVYKSNLHAGKDLSPKEKIEGKIEGKSSLEGPANDLFNIQKETGVIFTKVYVIHSHPSDTSPTFPTDYEVLQKIKDFGSKVEKPFKDAKIIGVIATPKKIFVYDERKYRPQPYN